MKTALERLRDVLAGAADDQTVDDLREELCDPASSTSMFFAGAKAVVKRPFAIDWTGLAAEAEELGVESAAADACLPSVPQQAARTGDLALQSSKEITRLEKVRDLLAGRVFGREPDHTVQPDEGTHAPTTGKAEPTSEKVILSSPSSLDQVGKYEDAPDELLVAVLAKQRPDEDVHVALEEVWRRYHCELIAVVRRWSAADSALADDVVQETFLWVMQAIYTGRIRDVSNISRYLKLVAHRILLSRLRQKLEPPLEHLEAFLEGVESPPDEEAARREQILAVQEAIKHLPPDRQIVLTMRLSGMTFSEIAARLGVSVTTVWKKFRNIVSELRQRFGVD